MIDHDLRRQGISGSDIAAILGYDRWRDKYSVWAEKKFNHPRADPTPRMRLGKALERGIVEYYGEITGRPTTWLDQTQRSPARPWHIMTPDAIVTNSRRGIDAKVVFYDQRRKWGETADDIPERVQLQCMWYLAGMDFDTWDVVALIGEDLPMIYEIHRDPDAERFMLDQAEEFYKRYIQGDEEPLPGASEASTEALQRIYPRPRPEIRQANADEIELLETYVDVRRECKELKIQRDEIENLLRRACGETDGIQWPQGRFTWKRCKDSEVVRWEDLALATLYHFEKDEAKREQALQEYTVTKPGTRRIRFISELEQEGAADAA